MDERKDGRRRSKGSRASLITRRRLLKITAYAVPAIVATVATTKQVAAKTLVSGTVTLSNILG